MKLKSLAVITLLVLGCSAAFGQSFSLGFLSYDMAVQYCDYEVLNYSNPYIAGTHDLTTACFLPLNAVMVGFRGDIPISTGAPVTGTVYILADSTFDAQYLGVSGCQIDWVTKATAYKPRYPAWGWSFYYTCGGGGDYLGNWGYLTKTLGASHPVGPVKTSFGAATANPKKQ